MRQRITPNAINIVVTNMQIRPIRKNISAMLSNRSLFSVLLRSDRKESRLAVINNMMEAMVNSSTSVVSATFNT